LEDTWDRAEIELLDRLCAGLDVGVEPLARPHGVPVAVPPAFRGGGGCETDDLRPLVVRDFECVEYLDDVGDVGAAVGVLQAADLGAGVVDALGEFVRHHPALLPEAAEYGREALSSYERADRKSGVEGEWCG